MLGALSSQNSKAFLLHCEHLQNGPDDHSRIDSEIPSTLAPSGAQCLSQRRQASQSRGSRAGTSRQLLWCGPHRVFQTTSHTGNVCGETPQAPAPSERRCSAPSSAPLSVTATYSCKLTAEGWPAPPSSHRPQAFPLPGALAPGPQTLEQIAVRTSLLGLAGSSGFQVLRVDFPSRK